MNVFSYIKELFNRVHGIVSFGRISIVDDTGNCQKSQVLLTTGDVVDLVRVLQHFGFASNPPPNTDIGIVFASGDRSKGIAVGTNSQTLRKKNLEIGAASMYDKNGNYVLVSSVGVQIFAGTNNVSISGKNINATATNSITLDAPDVESTNLLGAGNGWTGTFATGDARTATVRKGIITGVA